MRKRSPEVGGSNKMAFSIRPSFGLLIFERYYKKPIKDKETVSRGHLCAGQVSIRMYQYRRIVVETVLGYTVTTISLACYSRLLLVDVLRRDTNVTGLWRINSVESGSRKPHNIVQKLNSKRCIENEFDQTVEIGRVSREVTNEMIGFTEYVDTLLYFSYDEVHSDWHIYGARSTCLRQKELIRIMLQFGYGPRG
ncbi:hypothetical protein C8Q75DRAFT_737778 [Abortiporus biennis]|nr:hypothetical protein C8Q75DRAFT_737778 [Abortiporus biennis]